MNPIFIATFLCMGALVSGNPLLLNDGQWKGEGLLESQDWAGKAWVGPGVWGPGVWAGQAGVLGAPLGVWGLGGAAILDGHAINPAEVAVSKANLIAANVGVATSPLNSWKSPLNAWVSPYNSWASPLNSWASPLNSWASPVNSWAYGNAPIGIDGRVIDTPEVAITKAAHLNAKIAAVSGGLW